MGILAIPVGIAYWQYKKTGAKAVMPLVTTTVTYDGTFELQKEEITGPNVATTKLDGVAQLDFFLHNYESRRLRSSR